MPQTPEGAAKSAAKHAGISLEEYLARREVGEKRCYHCKEWKARECFSDDRSRYDGKHVKCRDCVRVKERKSTKGRVSTFKGKTHTPEARAKISAARKGKGGGHNMPHTAETRAKISAITRQRAVRGEAHYAYSHGRAQRHFSLRRRPEYLTWRAAVFERDQYTCQDCGDKRGGNLRAHHIKHLADAPELAYEVSNGITLCHPCHEQRHYKPDSIRNTRKLKRGERLWQ